MTVENFIRRCRQLFILLSGMRVDATRKTRWERETIEQVCTVASPVWASTDGGDAGDGGYSYEGIRLLTDGPEKLVPFVDQLLFALRVLGFKTPGHDPRIRGRSGDPVERTEAQRRSVTGCCW